MQQLFLGVDGGGTRCRMRLIDAKYNILGEAVIKKPANLQIKNGDAAYEVINELSKKVFALAKLDINQAGQRVFAVFGIAGGRTKGASEAFAKRKFPFAKTFVCDDIDIARTGAHIGKDGAILIIGTGSAGLGIMNGQRYQVGGWGFHIGDDMSGAILGRELLRQSLQAHEGLADTSDLTRAVMNKFSNQPEKLMEFSFNNFENKRPTLPSSYGEFVPMLLDYFEKNDTVAIKMVEYEMNMIEKYIHYFLDNKIKHIAIVGGLGERLFPMIKERFGKVILQPISSPLAGALIIAQNKFEII